MKSNKGGILGYRPGPVPDGLPPDARRYLDDELNRIAGVLQGLMAVVSSNKALALQPTYDEPVAPDMQQIVYAAGAPNWDPGSGPGYYYWNGAVWTPLG